MRMICMRSSDPSADLPPTAIVCHDVRNPAEHSEILARKGSSLAADAIRGLLGVPGIDELHLALADPNDMDENAAATRLAAAVGGRNVTAGAARHGQTNLVSRDRGMLRVDATRLDRVNAHDGVLVLTAEADRSVDAGATLGVVKCAPLLLAQSTLLAIEDLTRTSGAVVEVQPFRPMRVAFIAPRERLRGGAFDRAEAALRHAIEWFGSSLDQVVGTEATVGALAEAFHLAHRAGANLILAAGASGTDPLDVVFEGLRQSGGDVLQIGIPIEPGTACWIGRQKEVPVLGLASCELFGQPGALDLLLPRLLSGEELDAHLMRQLANGGLLLGMSRVAPYHAALAAHGPAAT